MLRSDGEDGSGEREEIDSSQMFMAILLKSLFLDFKYAYDFWRDAVSEEISACVE